MNNSAVILDFDLKVHQVFGCSVGFAPVEFCYQEVALLCSVAGSVESSHVEHVSDQRTSEVVNPTFIPGSSRISTISRGSRTKRSGQ